MRLFGPPDPHLEVGWRFNDGSTSTDVSFQPVKEDSQRFQERFPARLRQPIQALQGSGHGV